MTVLDTFLLKRLRYIRYPSATEKRLGTTLNKSEISMEFYHEQ
jgi:hypothetical protein